MKVGTHVWSNLGALKALLSRAERELSREPGGYVAVAVVGRDKAEEQVGRWEWTGSRDAAGRVGQHGGGLASDARGLRVRVHLEGGAAVGSALLRRTAVAVGRQEQPEPANAVAGYERAADGTEKLATIEKQLAWLLARSAPRGSPMGEDARSLYKIGGWIVSAARGLSPANCRGLRGLTSKDKGEAMEAGPRWGGD